MRDGRYSLKELIAASGVSQPTIRTLRLTGRIPEPVRVSIVGRKGVLTAYPPETLDAIRAACPRGPRLRPGEV